MFCEHENASASGRFRLLDPLYLGLAPGPTGAEMTLGQLVTGHGSSGSTNLCGSRGSRVGTRDSLIHDQVNKIPRTGCLWQ